MTMFITYFRMPNYLMGGGDGGSIFIHHFTLEFFPILSIHYNPSNLAISILFTNPYSTTLPLK